MKKFILNIGEVKTVSYPATFSCFGLGSCIGLFVQDRSVGISGGAHILLPENEAAAHKDGKAYNVSDALSFLMREFKRKGSSLESLRAKITGGANVSSYLLDTGEQNIESVTRYLRNHRIYIAARDVGGSQSRTAHFNTASGELRVHTSQRNTIKIF